MESINSFLPVLGFGSFFSFSFSFSFASEANDAVRPYVAPTNLGRTHARVTAKERFIMGCK